MLRCLIAVIFLSVLTLFLASCDKDKPTQPTTPANGFVSGVVTSPGREVLPDVLVSIGSRTTTTDSNGNFILNEIAPGSRIKVDFSKPGYISTQKIVTVNSGRTTYCSTSLYVPSIQSFSAGMAYTVVQQSNLIDLPANAFVDEQGNAFTGLVQAQVMFFDPTQAENLNAFPGSFSGVQTDGTETMFESYGFFNATFVDNANPSSILHLASGKQATITSYIPSALQANAPATIPIWYYDTEDGKWNEQGSATKTGNTYVCNVTHFSFWNFDHPITPTDSCTLTGRIVFDDGAGNITPAPGAQVVATGISYGGYNVVYSDAGGLYSINVKANAQVKLQAFSGENSSPFTNTINTPPSGQSLNLVDITISDLNFTMKGILRDSAGNPLSNIYGLIYRPNPPSGILNFSIWIGTDANGYFEADYTYPYPGSTFNLQLKATLRSDMYSTPISFTVPYAGETRDFGVVTMVPGGTITGRLQKNSGDYFGAGWVYAHQEGAVGEGMFFNGAVDANGYFSLQGPPSTSLNNMRLDCNEDNVNWQSQLLTLSFPASGGSTNIGTVVLSPAK